MAWPRELIGLVAPVECFLTILRRERRGTGEDAGRVRGRSGYGLGMEAIG